MLALLAAVAVSLAGCDVFPPAANPSSFVGESVDAVTLRIENLSKGIVEVEAIFLAGTQEVRRTHRQLAASGTEAYEDVIPTEADTVTVIAKRPLAAKAIAADRILQEQTYLRGIDYTGSETIVFSILPEVEPATPDPLPIVDCNSNGIADDSEIASNPSLDCNLDGIPDTCQVLEDCNQNGVPDICESLEDCNANGIPDECEVLEDCNADGIPDECQTLPDDDENGIPDACETPGDLDGDGIITMSDVSLFMSFLLDGQNPSSADLNGDGVVNGLDLQALVDLILQRTGSTYEQPHDEMPG